MRVLVIDDEQKNQDSARETLRGHELTVCGTVEEAARILRDRSCLFDAVMTDLWMPLPGAVNGEFMGVSSGFDRSEESEVLMPVGLVFAIQAKNHGVPHVVICTDKDHHDDRMVALFNIYSGRKTAQILMIDARSVPLGPWAARGTPIVKDWSKVLHMVVERPFINPKE